MNHINLIGRLRARDRMHGTEWIFTWYDAWNKEKTLKINDDLSEHMAKAVVGREGWTLAYRDGDSWWFNKESSHEVL